MHRKVPLSHWDYLMKWMSSSELVRRLLQPSRIATLSVASYGKCVQKKPWPGMIAKSTSKMWFNDQGPGPLNSQLPLYLVSFLELGLRPDIGLRKDFNLKRILWALRTKQELNFNGHSSQPSPESKITKAA